MTIKELKLTPTENRIVDMLSDGLPHSRDQLMTCLYDDMGSYPNLNQHLFHLRRKIAPTGIGIVCELVRRGIHYRMVRFLASACDGRQ